MGVNDAKEMLEVAKEECLRLELSNTVLRAELAEKDAELERFTASAIRLARGQAYIRTAITRLIDALAVDPNQNPTSCANTQRALERILDGNG